MLKAKLHPINWCIIALALITIARLLYLPFAPGLFFDEAQYWTWSHAMDWGFYSKPPMVAFWVWLTGSFCGDTETCIRISSPLLHLATASVIYYIGKALYRPRDGMWSAAIYLTLPAVTLSSSLVSTDPSLLFFWALSLLFFIHAIEKNQWKDWILCGIAAGLGLLSKYSMAFFLPSVILYLYTHEQHRHYFLQPKLWVAGLIAGLIFLPNIMWNIDNHFVSFLHTSDNANLARDIFNPEEFMEFFGAQFGVFGPLLFLILLAIFLTIPERLKTNHAGLLLCFILPFFVTICFISFLSRAHANWAAPIYIPATILVTHWLLTHRRFKWVLFTSLALHIFLLLTFLLFTPLTKVLGVQFAGKQAEIEQGEIRDPFLRLRGWEELGMGLTAQAKAYPDARLITVSRKTHAYLRYYARPFADNAIKWNADEKIHDHYELTTKLDTSSKQAYLLISEYENVDYITRYFKEVKRLDPLAVHIYPDYSLTYQLYYLKGYTKDGL